jgi:hypothetical protein
MPRPSTTTDVASGSRRRSKRRPPCTPWRSPRPSLHFLRADEGVALVALLEPEHGREGTVGDATLQQFQDRARPIASAEPALHADLTSHTSSKQTGPGRSQLDEAAGESNHVQRSDPR